MVDLLLIFPPQWSPFQPALSLPSLAAWLKRAGFGVRSLDLNLSFYEWLLSDECADLLSRRTEESDLPPDLKLAYRTIFSRVNDFRRDLARLKSVQSDNDEVSIEHRFDVHYVAVKSFETYMNAVSEVSREFFISPYDFRLNSGKLNIQELERQIAQPPSLLVHFLRTTVARHILPLNASCIGVSCIGQGQLYFTLLLGKLLKTEVDTPILVGGTILSRIFERGALRPEWFRTFFDVVVRNEGERPCEQLLTNLRCGRPLTENASGVVYADGGIIRSSTPCTPLSVGELPIPDFDDLPLGRYFSAETTLPLLSSRGCYWGKCEFCHHGMVYGEKYQSYDANNVLAAVQSLADRYGVRHFAFNDEAIPPRIARAIGRSFPSTGESGWNFTGLIKFERIFTREDFANLHRVGFRSLYVGLESASERVLALMKKNNKRETMERNLADATSAGIWMHCFLFFGFPGETEEDAQQTYDFMIANSNIIGSFGSATFALEHNAPIFHHLDEFHLRLKPAARDEVDVYYEYEVGGGVNAERALEWMNKINDAGLDIPKYNAAGWVPRELQLCLLSCMSPSKLLELGLELRAHGGLPKRASVPDIMSRQQHPYDISSRVAINRVNGRVLLMRGKSGQAFDLSFDHLLNLGELRTDARMLFDAVAYREERLSTEAVMSPVPTPL
jgi:anaerobic magnesium-protoporphyrin IX monomethyl ester cyclase